jgi:hypothetical protein
MEALVDQKTAPRPREATEGEKGDEWSTAPELTGKIIPCGAGDVKDFAGFAEARPDAVAAFLPGRDGATR